MTLDKAIEDLQARVVGEFNIQGEDDCADIKLGIEALRWIKEERELQGILYPGLLPGETKE